jgi:hypothetical protein
MNCAEQWVDLTCHPSTPAGSVRRVSAGVSRSTEGVLALSFRLEGDLARLNIPAPRRPAFTHQLWEHTCFEAFVALEGASAYHELNLAPSGEWAAYVFSAYREIAGLGDPALAPEIAVRSGTEWLDLAARLPLMHLSETHLRAGLQLGLSAVVEDMDGRHSYWALHHPAGRPDFHHADAFALRLEPLGAEW